MPVDSYNQSQLKLLKIFNEHPGELLSTLAPQIAEIFNISTLDVAKEKALLKHIIPPESISKDQDIAVFDVPEFSQIIKIMRKEWLIDIEGVDQPDKIAQYDKSLAANIRIRVERRGSEALDAGEIPPSAISRRKPRLPKPSTTSDTVRELVDRKVKGLRKPTNQREATEKIAAEIAARRGQKEFRDKLLSEYGATCLITGPNIEAILEAAHIQPYAEGGAFDIANGLLLRADIHTLFDLHLISVDSATMTVLVSPELNGTLYANLGGEQLRFPKESKERPSTALIDQHREVARL